MKIFVILGKLFRDGLIWFGACFGIVLLFADMSPLLFALIAAPFILYVIKSAAEGSVYPDYAALSTGIGSFTAIAAALFILGMIKSDTALMAAAAAAELLDILLLRITRHNYCGSADGRLLALELGAAVILLIAGGLLASSQARNLFIAALKALWNYIVSPAALGLGWLLFMILQLLEKLISFAFTGKFENYSESIELNTPEAPEDTYTPTVMGEGLALALKIAGVIIFLAVAFFILRRMKGIKKEVARTESKEVRKKLSPGEMRRPSAVLFSGNTPVMRLRRSYRNYCRRLEKEGEVLTASTTSEDIAKLTDESAVRKSGGRRLRELYMRARYTEKGGITSAEAREAAELVKALTEGQSKKRRNYYMTNDRKSMINDLTVGSVPRQLLIFAGPLMISGILQTAYNMVDMIVVGRFVGTEGLAAVSIGGDVLHLLTFIAMGLSNAGQVLISQAVGAGERQRISRLIGTMFTFLLGCGLAMTALCLLLKNHIMRWVNTPAEAWDYSMDYVTVCILGLVFIYGYNLVSSILRGMGDSKHPLLFIAIASVVNLILDLIFVAVFHWAAFGAALATVIGQGVSFICALIILYRRREQFGFDFKPRSFGIKRDVFPGLMALGIPMMLQNASVAFSKLFVSSWINSYGAVAAAVTGIGTKLESVINMINRALNTGGGSMIAQCIGAKKYERVPKVMRTVLIYGGTLSAIMIGVTLLWPRGIFGIFTTDTAALDMAMSFVPVAVILYIGSAIRPVGLSLINGSGHSRLNLAVAILDGVVMRIGFTMLLGVVLHMGIYGFWYGNAFAGWMPLFIGMAFYISGKWKKPAK